MPYPTPPRFSGVVHRHYWSERAHERTEFLAGLVERLSAERVPTEVHEGWTRDDLTVFPHAWTAVSVRTVQEDHSGGRRLLRVRLRLFPNAQVRWALGGAAALGLVALATPAVPAAVGAVGLVALVAVAWRCGLERRARLAALADEAARAVGLLSMQPSALPERAPEAEGAEAEAEVQGAPAPAGALEGVFEGLRDRQFEPAGA